MDFWDRTKREIKKQHTTQEWVATKAKINIPTFRGWITRRIMPNADQAVAIAEALDVSVEYLVTGHDRKLHPENLKKLFEDVAQLPPEDIAEIQALVSFKLNRKPP